MNKENINGLIWYSFAYTLNLLDLLYVFKCLLCLERFTRILKEDNRKAKIEQKIKKIELRLKGGS
jgi:hypothetical protein